MSEKFLLLSYEFLHFLRNPRDYRNKGEQKLATFVLNFLVLDIVLLIPVVILVGILSDAFGIDPPSKIEDFVEDSPLVFAFSAIVLAPLLEEPVFRFFIRLKYAFYFVYPIKIIGNILGVNHFRQRRWLIHYWSVLFPYIFYGSSLLFGFVHIFNFENSEMYLWYFPILTLPQILLGFIFGFIRVTYGIKYSIFFHALHNGLLVLPVTIYYLLK